jgi:DNA polymerase-4
VAQLEATLMRLSEMVGRRLRENQLRARTLQLKLRYKDFTTITRAHSLDTPTQLDNEIFQQIHRLFHINWRKGAEVRLLGVQASHFGQDPAQLDFLEDQGREKWENVLSAADRLRDKFGEGTITLGTGMKGGFRERTHENPAALPGKLKKENNDH